MKRVSLLRVSIGLLIGCLAFLLLWIVVRAIYFALTGIPENGARDLRAVPDIYVASFCIRGVMWATATLLGIGLGHLTVKKGQP